MSKRILVTGGAGQLGQAFGKVWGDRAHLLTRAEMDLSDEGSLQRWSTSLEAYELVVNCAAENKVDLAEDYPQAAWQTNALGARSLAKLCDKYSVPLVHFSTDYVFGLDPQRTVPYSESDLPGPLGVYAISKLAGEQFVLSSCSRSFVIRTCGLYGFALSGKTNFVRTMLKLGRERESLRIVNDQRCTPTSCDDLASAIAKLAETQAYGLYHATNSGSCTWAEFAKEIFRLAGLPTRIEPITTAEFGAKAQRPRFSVLNSERLSRAAQVTLPPWQESLARYVAQVTQSS